MSSGHRCHVQREVLLKDLRRYERTCGLDPTVLKVIESFLEGDGHFVGHFVEKGGGEKVG